MVRMPTAVEIAALQQALADALRQNHSLAGELRVVRTERDLLKEQLNKFRRQLFAAKSEVSGQHQKDMFFDEAGWPTGSTDTAISEALLVALPRARTVEDYEALLPGAPLWTAPGAAALTAASTSC